MSKESENILLHPWDSTQFARAVEPLEVELSRGFLRSQPEKLFPGFAAQWSPLLNSVGCDLRLTEVRPMISLPRSVTVGFGATVNNEALALLVDEAAFNLLLEAIAPGIAAQPSTLVAEYFARRFITSLALSWSGPQASVVHFDSSVNPHAIASAGTVRISGKLNGAPISFWLVLGRGFAEQIDQLWRKQYRSAVRASEQPARVALEIAQLAVPPSLLTDYLKAGSNIDLETAPSDSIVLRVGNKAWLPAKIISIAGKLGFEIQEGAVTTTAIPDNTTRLCIDLAHVKLDPATISELTQPGAMLNTGANLSDQVIMSVQGEQVARAALSVYEGRLAITVEDSER